MQINLAAHISKTTKGEEKNIRVGLTLHTLGGRAGQWRKEPENYNKGRKQKHNLVFSAKPVSSSFGLFLSSNFKSFFKAWVFGVMIISLDSLW